MGQYHDSIIGIHGPGVRSELRRLIPQPKNGAQIVTEELEELNRRFAQLSSVILERKNIVNVLIQNWRRKQQVGFLSMSFMKLRTEDYVLLLCLHFLSVFNSCQSLY